LNRVWHRQIPSPAPKKPPSSVQFCESNILVGRANNTRFDLVQITSEIVVLSRIDFAALSPSPPNLHFAQAKYDSTRNILWVAPFSRGSLYGFRYALKGQSPVKGDASGNVPTIVAFDKVAEFPLEPVLSFVVADRPLQQDAEIFFATPNGFKQAGIAKAVCDELRKPGEFDARAESVKSDAPLASPKKEPNGTPSIKQSSKQPSPIKVKSELPTLDNEPEMPAFAASNSARDVNQQVTVPRPMDAALPDAAVVLVGISAEELNRALKGVSVAVLHEITC